MKERITLYVKPSGFELYKYTSEGWKILSYENLKNGNYLVKLERDISESENDTTKSE